MLFKDFFVFSLDNLRIWYILYQWCVNHNKAVILFVCDFLNALYPLILSLHMIFNLFLWYSILFRYLYVISSHASFFCTDMFCLFFPWAHYFIFSLPVMLFFWSFLNLVLFSRATVSSAFVFWRIYNILPPVSSFYPVYSHSIAAWA